MAGNRKVMRYKTLPPVDAGGGKTTKHESLTQLFKDHQFSAINIIAG
jgi:hypothetical protein